MALVGKGTHCVGTVAPEPWIAAILLVVAVLVNHRELGTEHSDVQGEVQHGMDRRPPSNAKIKDLEATARPAGIEIVFQLLGISIRGRGVPKAGNSADSFRLGGVADFEVGKTQAG